MERYVLGIRSTIFRYKGPRLFDPDYKKLDRLQSTKEVVYDKNELLPSVWDACHDIKLPPAAAPFTFLVVLKHSLRRVK